MALLVAAAVAAPAETRADAAPVSVADEIVALALDAEGAAFDVIADEIVRRGGEFRAALDRARRGDDDQRAWLAEALSVQADAGRRVEAADSSVAEERARRVILALKGSPASRTGGAFPLSETKRVDAVLSLAAEGDTRAIPWLEHIVDSGVGRWRAERALLERKLPGAVARTRRSLADRGAGAALPVDFIGLVAATRDVRAAVPLLLRVEAGQVSVATIGDDGVRAVPGGEGDRAVARALEELRAADSSAFSAAWGETTQAVRTYEAEAMPVYHSGGAAGDGTWEAKRGRDGAGHIVYGPYVEDLPNEWLYVRFHWRVDAFDGSPDDALFDCEVTSQEMERRGIDAHAATVRASDVRAGEWQTTTLRTFPHQGGARMEFRVYWEGTCDLAVDRIDVLHVRRETSFDRSDFPPLAPCPLRRARSPYRISTDTARSLFERAAAARGAAHEAWRDTLFRDPATSRTVLQEEAGRVGGGDKAWLAEVLLTRMDSTTEVQRLRGAHDRSIETTAPDSIRVGMLASGRAAVPIERQDAVPHEGPRGIEWVEPAWFRWKRKTDHVLPASRLWPAVLAEIWLTSWPEVLLAPEDHDPPLPDGAPPQPASRGSPREVVSTVGVGRLHALLHLARLGERRALPHLAALADDGGALVEERAAALHALASLDATAAWPRLSVALDAAHPAVAEAAIDVLGRTADPRAVAALWRRALAADPAAEGGVGWEFWALRRIRDEHPDETTRLEAEVLEVLHSWDGADPAVERRGGAPTGDGGWTWTTTDPDPDSEPQMALELPRDLPAEATLALRIFGSASAGADGHGYAGTIWIEAARGGPHALLVPNPPRAGAAWRAAQSPYESRLGPPWTVRFRRFAEPPQRVRVDLGSETTFVVQRIEVVALRR